MNHDQYNSADAELIQSIQSGDKEAFAGLYRAVFFNLCDFAHRYVNRPSVCEEFVQDVFLSIWKNREEWDPKGSIRSYLYRAVKNRALDYLKHLVVEREYLALHAMDREWESLNSRADVSASHEQCDELAGAIEEAINRLPDRRKMIFNLSREDGLTYKEIAEVLDISVKTVETQMGRALKTLRHLLTDYLPGLAFLVHHLQNWL